MQKLYELYIQGRYDVIVLDPPPTKQALDFLDAPGRMPIEEARFFYDKLRQYDMPFGGFIINRVHRDLLLGPQGTGDSREKEAGPKTPSKDSLEKETRRSFGDFAGTLLENFRNVQILAEIDEARIAEFVGSLDREAPLWTIPFFGEGIFDMAGLDRVGRHIFESSGPAHPKKSPRRT